MRSTFYAFLLTICSVVLPTVSKAQTTGQTMDRQVVAREYAEVVGRLALTDRLFYAMSEQCSTEVEMSSQSYSAIDYVLRMQTNVSFFQWRKQFSDPTKEADLVKQLIATTLNDIGGCEEDAVNLWFKGMEQNLIEPSIERLNELPDLPGISNDRPSDEQITKVFMRQLAHYQTLSLAEIRGLAMALEEGLYRYSMIAFTNRVAKDYEMAVSLREYIYAKSQMASDLYELADTLRFTDRMRAVALYGEAAEQGSFYAQRWFGTYQACIANKKKALLWLEKAKETEPEEAEFIDDIIVEIKELGEPTNCLDGWVY